jgi:hypothetical protein
MNEQEQVQFLRSGEKRLEARIVEGLFAYGVTDLQPFESNALSLFSNRHRVGNALQRHTAEADESVRKFSHDRLYRFVLAARKVRRHVRLFPIE